VLSVLLGIFTDSDYPFGILWPLYCMSFGIRILMTPLVSSNFSFNCSFDNKDISIICMYCWHRNNDFTTHHSRWYDMTHLRRTGTTVRAKVVFTEYTLFKSKKELYTCIRWFVFSSIFPLHNCIPVSPSLKSILKITIFCVVEKPLFLRVFILTAFHTYLFHGKESMKVSCYILFLVPHIDSRVKIIDNERPEAI
jgi:hypothetical protein